MQYTREEAARLVETYADMILRQYPRIPWS